ncbi:MAG: TIGR01777 family oxidoreductase [Vulcanimicrobiaceae bacterium]
MRVAILGASGFIGRHLTAALQERGDDVRSGSLRDPQAAAALAGGYDAVVNLAGETIVQRWTGDAKRRIEESRTKVPHAFLDALANVANRPAAYISASAVGYYGTSETLTFTEENGPGNDFLARVCVESEREAGRARDLGMRVACIRAGLVLGTDGGALAKMLPPFKMGVGGKVGSGRQWYSWIHVDDLTGIYMHALDPSAARAGALNATAPNPVRNQEFTHELAKALRRPAVLPVPPFAIKSILGEGAIILLEGQRVLPRRTQEQGFVFKFPTLDAAFADLLG